MSRKVFTAGEVLTAADVNSFLMDQSVMSFATSASRGSAIASPIEGMVTYLEDNNSYQSWDGSAWVGLAPQSANAIINGAFDIWQRGTSFTGFTSGFVFTSDRWAMYNNGTGTQTVSRQTFTPGDSPVPGAQFYLRNNFATVGTTTGFNFINRIEDVRTFAGQTVAWSFWARSSNTQTIQMNFNQNFGTGGSSEVNTSGGSAITLTASWTRYSGTINVPSISGKTIGAGSSLGLYFGSGGSVKTGDMDIVGVQLEAGSVATPFRRNANSIQGELAACQRYYYRTQPGAVSKLLGAAAVGSTTTASIFGSFPVEMRTAPTALEQSGTANQYAIAHTASTTCSAVPTYASSTTTTMYGVVFTVASGLTIGHAARGITDGTNGVNAYLGWSAEL